MESQKKQALKIKIINWMIILTSIILGIAFILSIYFSAQIGNSKNSNNQNILDNGHYAVLFIGNETHFISDLKEGMLTIANKNEIAIEFYEVNDIAQATSIIELLVQAGIDGIITQGINDTSFLIALKSVTQAKIPLVLLYTDLAIAERDAFVGINPFEMGNEIAKLTVASKATEGNVVFISQSASLTSENPASKMNTLGFLDGLEGYIDPGKVMMKMSLPVMLSAEGLISELFIDDQGITAVVCTNETDTIGVAQAVVDLNRVGKTTIIGTGFTKEIAEYIDKGVVYGTIYRNPINMGSEAVLTLINLPEAETYVEIPLDIITKENIDLYRDLIGGKP